MWVSETAGRQEFTNMLRDTYPRKMVAVTEVRSLQNAFAINFSAFLSDKTTGMEPEVQDIRHTVYEALKQVPEHFLVIYDRFFPNEIDDIDYFVMHSPKDADAIMAILDQEKRKKLPERDFAWFRDLKGVAPDKLIVLGYDERFRDLVEIDEQTALVSVLPQVNRLTDHKYRRDSAQDESVKMIYKKISQWGV